MTSCSGKKLSTDDTTFIISFLIAAALFMLFYSKSIYTTIDLWLYAGITLSFLLLPFLYVVKKRK